MVSKIFRQSTRIGIILSGLVMAWFLTMAVIIRFVDTPSAVMVVAPNFDTLKSLDEDILLVRGGRYVFVMTSTKPGYVKRLYQSGAWLVLPSLRNGCLDLNALKKRVRTRAI